MTERFICPFCGRDDIYRKCSFTYHVKYCNENPNRVESVLKGRVFSEEHKQKLSETSKRMWENPEHKQKMSEAQKGKKLSDETKQKLSETKKGKKLSEEHKQKISEGNKIAQNRQEVKQKISESSKRMWADPEYKQKLSETIKKAYENPELRQKLSEAQNNPDVQQKKYNTKKQNNSFNSSKIEEQLKEYFTSHNINFKTQYKSKEYPFMCDFYFPDKDLFVEIQGTWTHGKRPFNSEDEECINQLELWKSKNTDFYNSAIKTWTERDVKKRETAKMNNLNWIEIFSDNLDECLETIKNKLLS